MTIKEQLVKILQEHGCDLFRACELANEFIAEFKASGKDRMKFYCGVDVYEMRSNNANNH